jgi:hypothetical protein
MSILDSIVGTVRDSAQATVTIRSNVTWPPIVIPTASPLPEDPNAVTLGQVVASWLKPSILVESNFGTFKFEPYGPPSDATAAAFTGIVAVGVLALVMLAGYGTYKLVQR